MHITKQEKIDRYYQALIDREDGFVGIFFVGVKTTSVFCIANCRARKPKKENVVFYTNFKEAMDNGYRPCKICKPTENAHKTPEEVVQAIQMVKESPKEKIKDYQLREANISPDFVRRWFKKQYGMTFHTYQRMFRINNAFQELKHGKKTSEVAYNAGYESLSGFGYTYKKLLGKSSSKSSYENIILINRFTTRLGPMFVCVTDKGVCLLEFVDRRMLETEFKDLQKKLKANIIIGENEHSKQAKKEITEYFNGERKNFEVALHAVGTDFQHSVWNALQKIPYGTTSTYQQQAERINKPNAIRAVGAANGFNRISIMVPCHRVIGKNGKLIGYGGGIERKQWLLDHEAKQNAS